ncbi:MAG: protein-methionine-sulfoxide reductase heme-binding subunit MsrQ [Rhodospirillales bacterium]
MAAKKRNWPRLISKAGVFIVCLGPVAWIFWRALTGGPDGLGLTANPPEYLNRFIGDWALRFVLIALAITPLRLLTGRAWLMRFRRMLGLYAFFYVTLHLTSYVVIDQFFDWSAIWEDILKRTYITVGMIAFVMLIPLAVTSTARMVRRLGPDRWKRVHQMIYVIAPLGCVHYIMMAKGNQMEPWIYLGIAVALLAVRLVRFVSRRRAAHA